MKIFIANNLKNEDEIKGFKVSQSSYSDFFSKKRRLSDFIKYGFSGSSLFAKLRNPEFLNFLYLNKDKDYFNYLHYFKEKYKNYDVIVMNPGLDLVHPEFLYKHFSNSLKCLHFIDDPHSTYSYGLPFSWAFDCATYISPSYSQDFTMQEILQLSGFKNTKWIPHNYSNNIDPLYNDEELEESLSKRLNKITYVGGFYTKKVKRLIKVKREFGNNFDIYGQYPLSGLIFPILSLKQGIPNFYRVKKINNKEREDIYKTYGIGLNMHLSDPSLETGNARTYELAYRGLAQVVDASKTSLISNIFNPEEEVLTYESLDECISKLDLLRKNRDLRISLARNAYKKAISNYQYKNNLIDLFSWFKKIKKDEIH